MIRIEWEVINKEKNSKEFSSILLATKFFERMYNKWKTIVPVLKTVVDENNIMIIFSDGYILLTIKR